MFFLGVGDLAPGMWFQSLLIRFPKLFFLVGLYKVPVPCAALYCFSSSCLPERQTAEQGRGFSMAKIAGKEKEKEKQEKKQRLMRKEDQTHLDKLK